MDRSPVTPDTPPEPDGLVEALVIGPDGSYAVRRVRPEPRTYAQIVGSWPDLFYPHKDWHLYCHETIRRDPSALTENYLANTIARWADPLWRTWLRGVVVIVGTSAFGHDLDVPVDVLRFVRGDLK